MREKWWEQPARFINDYGLILLAVLLVAAVAVLRLNASSLLTPVPSAGLPLPVNSTPVPGASQTPSTHLTLAGGTPTANNPTAAPTSTPNPKPDFILVFMPLAWQSDQASFDQAAHLQADTFIQESRIDSYFTVKVDVLTIGPKNVSLSDPELVSTILEFGLTHQAGDRYIGLTDSDLSRNGDNNVNGWTSGGQAAVEESGDKYITSHEMGHTYGLCDEYNFAAWTEQNNTYTGGCPNPYPSTCPHTMADGVICIGNPASDGSNSIMGSAGLPGEYEYNSSCMDYLLQDFSKLASQVSQ